MKLIRQGNNILCLFFCPGLSRRRNNLKMVPQGVFIFIMSTEETNKENKKTRSIDKMHLFACDIKQEKAGGKYLYCLADDKFYNYKNGYWESLYTIDFMARIEEGLKEIIKYSISQRNQIAENFKRLGRKRLEEFNWSELINIKNGMLNPYDGVLQDHDPIFYSTNRLPYMYDENATCGLWLKTLDEIFEGDNLKSNILQEFFGYCLTREIKYHKALLLLGESRSGKSTILQTLRNMIGTNNCSSVPLKYVDNPQYTVRMINKLVNIDTDVSAKASEFEAEFKTITSGEPIQAKVLYTDSFDFVPYCKIVMAANIFPKITDHSSAFYNRLILIPCDRVFTPEEQNRNLPAQLLKELPGILNWAIEGLKRLHKRGRFEELSFMKDAVEELENENNPVNLFFEEHIEKEYSCNIEKGYLFDKFIIWCNQTNNYKLSKARFASCVYKKFHKDTPKDARESHNGKRVWRNIRYVEFKTERIEIEIPAETVRPHLQTIEAESRQVNSEIDWSS